jgi:hypothetical protein
MMPRPTFAHAEDVELIREVCCRHFPGAVAIEERYGWHIVTDGGERLTESKATEGAAWAVVLSVLIPEFSQW